MRAVVQRVIDCSVTVDEVLSGHIDEGLLVYLGVGKDDVQQDVTYLAEKTVHLRVFPDELGKMNRSLIETGGGILVVSQFTLYGDARRGRRPSYTEAALPEKANGMYTSYIDACRAYGLRVENGVFAARMNVSYTNVGPVTILLDSSRLF